MRGRTSTSLLVSLSLATALFTGPAGAAAAAPLPIPSGALGVTTIGNAIYAVGGADSYGGSNTRDLLQIYSVSSGTWTQGAVMPDANGWGPGVVTSGGSLYAVGGWPSGGALMRRYDPGTNQWTNLAPIPSPGFLWGHATVAVGNSIYAVGGTAGASMQHYDVTTDTWTPLAAAPFTGVMAGVTEGSKLYIITASGVLQIYDIATDTWTEGPRVPAGADGPSAALANGIMFVFFGQSNVDSDVVYGYEIGTGTWRRYAAGGQLWTWSAATIASDGIHVLGGFASAGPAADHLVFDPASPPLPDDARCEDDPDAQCGTDGDDDLTGTPEADVIFGGDGNDTIESGGGDDEVSGDAGDDTLETGGGNDTANGGTGHDRVFAGAGTDLAKGGAGNDLLQMAGGLDKAVGGGGRDVIEGGPGFDSINGGKGLDTCYFSSRKEKRAMKSCETKRPDKRAH